MQKITLKELENKGFTLVELVVVIAVMAVLLAVLAPALLRNVEESRMQKDESAMGEVCHSIKLAMSDAEIYDEVCAYAIPNNYITYSDSSGVYGAQYTDEEFWAPDGSGRAVTITFNPDENGNYDIANGLVNNMTLGNGSVAEARTADGVQQCLLSEMGDGKLYTAIKKTIGTTLGDASATYKNSSYTVFIKLEKADGVYHADVYGLFNGTNLSPSSQASLGSGTTDYDSEGNAEPSRPTGGTRPPEYDNTDLGGGGTSGNPGVVEDLQDRYQFEYYSSIVAAVNDITNNSIGANADMDREGAAAGIYTDGGKVSVVLLKNCHEVERIEVYKDMTLVLGGYTLTSDDNVVIDHYEGHLIVDGTVRGSTITVSASAGHARAIQARDDGVLTVKGGTYFAQVTGDLSACAIKTDLPTTIENAKLTAVSTTGPSHAVESHYNTFTVINCDMYAESLTGDRTVGFYIGGNASGTITNSKMNASAQNIHCYGLELYAGNVVVNNCTMRGYINFTQTSETYSPMSVGVSNRGTMTLTDCDVAGGHAGLLNYGTVTVDGGTYQGFGAGGFYLRGDSSVARIKNATIKQGTIPSGYTVSAPGNEAGMFIGGGGSQKNISVYMDNCSIYSNGNQIVLRGSSGEQNNKLYISNSSLYDMNGNTISVRIDNDTLGLYLGQGNNFTAANTNRSGVVVDTGERYN